MGKGRGQSVLPGALAAPAMFTLFPWCPSPVYLGLRAGKRKLEEKMLQSWGEQSGLGTGCGVQVHHPALGLCCSLSLGAHLLPAAFWFQQAQGWGQAWHGSLAPAALCCGSSSPVLVYAAQHGCLGRQSHPELEEPVPSDGRGVRRVFGTVGQHKPQGTIPTLSFSSRSPQEEAGLAPNCCHFSPWFSRPPCSGLRGAGKVVPISFPPAL